MDASTIDIEARKVTDAEVTSFREQGWARLNSLISEETANSLRERIQDKMGDAADIAAHPAGEKRGNGYETSWRTFAPLAVEQNTGKVADEVFYNLCHSSGVGAAAEALMGTPMRYWVDEALVKMPVGVNGSGETRWHTDVGSLDNSPFNPARQLQVWIALTEITPELGALRFVSPQDATEEVVKILKNKGASENWRAEESHYVEDSYKELDALGVLSPAETMKAGDATVHSGATWHSAPPNRTDRIRWVYVLSLFPADTRFSGMHVWPSENVEGVREGETFPDSRYPVLAS
jgi:hypothetical protein